MEKQAQKKRRKIVVKKILFVLVNATRLVKIKQCHMYICFKRCVFIDNRALLLLTHGTIIPHPLFPLLITSPFFISYSFPLMSFLLLTPTQLFSPNPLFPLCLLSLTICKNCWMCKVDVFNIFYSLIQVLQFLNNYRFKGLSKRAPDMFVYSWNKSCTQYIDLQ